MAKKKSVRKTARKTTPARKSVRKAARKAVRRKAPRAKGGAPNPLFAPVKGAERREVGHVQLEVGRAGDARVKRMVYPPGFRWSVDMKPAVGTDLCMHAHVGFLVHGEIHIEYADGCIVEHRAPQIVAIDPGHDGWVVGDEPVVLIDSISSARQCSDWVCLPRTRTVSSAGANAWIAGLFLPGHPLPASPS